MVEDSSERTGITVHQLTDDFEDEPISELANEGMSESVEEPTNDAPVEDDQLFNHSIIRSEVSEVEEPTMNSDEDFITKENELEEESLLDQQLSEPNPMPEEIEEPRAEETPEITVKSSLDEPTDELEETRETTFTPEVDEQPKMISFDLPRKEPKVTPEPEVKKFDLFGETPNDETKKPQLPEEPQLINKAEVSAEAEQPELDKDDLQRMQSERFERIRATASKFRTPASLNELENVPAYKRRNVKLNNVPHSSENPVSKFTLTDNGEGENGSKGTDLRSNNSFLHDNVDYKDPSARLRRTPPLFQGRSLPEPTWVAASATLPLERGSTAKR